MACIMWMAISFTYIFPAFPEVWKSLDGDVSVYVGQTVNYTNILIGVLPITAYMTLLTLEIIYERIKFKKDKNGS